MHKCLVGALAIAGLLGLARTSRAEIITVGNPLVLELPFVDGTGYDLLGLTVYVGGLDWVSQVRVDIYDDLGGPLRQVLAANLGYLRYESPGFMSSTFPNFDGGALVISAIGGPLHAVFIELRGAMFDVPGYDVVYRHDFALEPSLPPPPPNLAQVPEPSVFLAMIPGAWLLACRRRRLRAP